MSPTAVIGLANLRRRRRGDTAPRAPLVDVAHARRALAEEGLTIDGLIHDDLLALGQIVDAVSELGDDLALGRGPASHAVEVINELAARCTGTTKLSVSGEAVRRQVEWRDPDPVAGLARRIIEELDGADPNRLRQCQRTECDLLFFDPTRSRTQRWHAENPCGWLERQHRHRARE
jgi:predicted RNA-binding Zn ribbon-like protein